MRPEEGALVRPLRDLISLSLALRQRATDTSKAVRALRLNLIGNDVATKDPPALEPGDADAPLALAVRNQLRRTTHALDEMDVDLRAIEDALGTPAGPAGR